jgi:multicomponent Na+:H+ antiporter subunit G
VSPLVVDVLSAVLLLGGALQCLFGALGMLRLPSLLSRMQAATKTQTLGLLLILGGVAMRVPPAAAATLVLVAVFQLLVNPVLGQLVGRSAYRSGAVQPDILVADELADRLRDDG